MAAISSRLYRASVFLGVLLAPSTASAQTVLKGLVRQDSTGIPLTRVEVIAEGAGKQTTSDRGGRFTLRDLPYGPQTILFRQIGFRNRTALPCWASIVVDGAVKYRDGASLGPPPELESEFSISELESIEVYRSAAEYPAEFSGTVGSCGLVVFWTRRGR